MTDAVYADLAVLWRWLRMDMAPRRTSPSPPPQVTIPEHIQAALAVGMTEKGVIDTVVGDVQRMELYAQKGYQIPQPAPPAVRSAYERLVAAGYTGQLIGE